MVSFEGLQDLSRASSCLFASPLAAPFPFSSLRVLLGWTSDWTRREYASARQAAVIKSAIDQTRAVMRLKASADLDSRSGPRKARSRGGVYRVPLWYGLGSFVAADAVESVYSFRRCRASLTAGAGDHSANVPPMLRMQSYAQVR